MPAKPKFQEELERLRKAFQSPKRGFEKRVLLVDDNEELVHLLSATIGGGFTPEIALDGREALRKLSMEAYDLVVVDLHLPDISGVEVLVAARKSLPSVKLLAITGDTQGSKLVQEAKAAGALTVVHKPLPAPTEFRALLGQFLLKSSAQK